MQEKHNFYIVCLYVRLEDLINVLGKYTFLCDLHLVFYAAGSANLSLNRHNVRYVVMMALLNEAPLDNTFAGVALYCQPFVTVAL